MELNDDLLYEVAPFAALLGIHVEVATPDRVLVRLPHRAELGTLGGGMHGGALMSLCDVAAALCAAAQLPRERVSTTAESSTYFLAPLRGRTALAEATPVRIGRSLICVQVDVRDENGKHCVRTTQMLAVQDTGPAPTR